MRMPVGRRPFGGAAVVAAAACIATVPLGAGAAWADWDSVLGPLAISPLTGDLETPITITTAGGCPHGTSTITRIYGPGFPEGGENVIGNSETIEFGSPPADRMVAPLTITIGEAVRRQPKKITLDGEYRIFFNCQERMPSVADEVYGGFEGKLTIKDEHFTALTTDKDLPETPSPKAGPDAMAEKPLPAAEVPVPTPNVEAEKQLAAAKKSADTNGAALALAIGGGIILLAGGGAVLARRPQRSVGARK